jgi:hypothetical protein
MKRVLTGLLFSTAAFAALCAPPALANGNGGDANAEANQAQIHPQEANQTPDWAPGQVAVGEVYPAVPGENAFYGPNGPRQLGRVTLPTQSCPLLRDTTNGRETVVCGP